MRTKKSAKSQSAIDDTFQPKTGLPEPRIESEGSEQPINPGLPEPSQSERKAIAWYENPDGTIQWDRMRDSTKEQLRQFLSNKSVLAALNLNPEAPVQPVEVFDPEWTSALYDTLGKIEQVAVTRIWKVSPEIAGKVFVYTKEEKDKLQRPTTNVINKYATDWMIRFKDEIALAMLLFAITASKIATLQGALQVQAQMDKMKADLERQAKAQAAPAVAPDSVEENKAATV